MQRSSTEFSDNATAGNLFIDASSELDNSETTRPIKRRRQNSISEPSLATAPSRYPVGAHKTPSLSNFSLSNPSEGTMLNSAYRQGLNTVNSSSAFQHTFTAFPPPMNFINASFEDPAALPHTLFANSQRGDCINAERDNSERKPPKKGAFVLEGPRPPRDKVVRASVADTQMRAYHFYPASRKQ